MTLWLEGSSEGSEDAPDEVVGAAEVPGVDDAARKNVVRSSSLLMSCRSNAVNTAAVVWLVRPSLSEAFLNDSGYAPSVFDSPSFRVGSSRQSRGRSRSRPRRTGWGR